MKKISILGATACIVCLTLFLVCSESHAQSEVTIRQYIEKANTDFVRWFNNGQIDSLMTLYRDDACIVGKGCGKSFVCDYYTSESYRYKFKKLETLSLSVSDSIAVEKERWVIDLSAGVFFSGECLTIWHRTDNKWLIVNEAVVVQ